MCGVNFSRLMAWDICFKVCQLIKLYRFQNTVIFLTKYKHNFIDLSQFYIFMHTWLVVIIAIAVSNQINTPFWMTLMGWRIIKPELIIIIIIIIKQTVLWTVGSWRSPLQLSRKCDRYMPLSLAIRYEAIQTIHICSSVDRWVFAKNFSTIFPHYLNARR